MLFQNILISSIILAIKSDAEFDACKENPCMNGATCLQDGTFSYKCLCPLGYFGQNCTTKEKFPDSEEDSNESKSSDKKKCFNGGKFVKDGLPCFCLDGYSGSRCEVYTANKLCTVTTCLNDGTCHQIGTNFRCQCYGYYYGPRCEFLRSYNRRTTGISSFSSLLMIIGLIALIAYCFCFKQKRNDTGPFSQGNNNGFSGVFLRPGGVSYPYPQSSFLNPNPASSNFNYPTFVNTPNRLPHTQIPDPVEANRVNQAPPSYEEVQKMKKPNV